EGAPAAGGRHGRRLPGLGRRAGHRHARVRSRLSVTSGSGPTMESQQIADKAAAVMPAVIADLERLVAIPSVAFPGYPSEPVERMAEETLRLFRDVGFENVELMEVPTGYLPIYAEIAGPPGSPVVMLYAHYDV